MDIIYKNGNLLDSKDRILVHQVNCQGRMGSGVAKALANEFPELLEDYQEYINDHKRRQKDVFGTCYIHTAHDRNSYSGVDYHAAPTLPIAIGK